MNRFLPDGHVTGSRIQGVRGCGAWALDGPDPSQVMWVLRVLAEDLWNRCTITPWDSPFWSLPWAVSLYNPLLLPSMGWWGSM